MTSSPQSLPTKNIEKADMPNTNNNKSKNKAYVGMTKSFKPVGVAPFTYGLWRHFVLLGALHLAWLFILLIAQMAGYHGFDNFVLSFLGLGGR